MSIRIQIKAVNNNQIPSLERYKILEAINRMSSKRNKALLAFLYLTGCRISEVVRYKKKGALIGQPIKKKQIEIRRNELRIYNVRVLKSRIKHKIRVIPILINDLERQFINHFLEYYKGLDNPDTYLFNLSRDWVYRLLAKEGLFPHWLRHARLTHLVVDYDFNEQQLQKFTGWDTTKTAPVYTHLKVDDLFDKMKKAQL